MAVVVAVVVVVLAAGIGGGLYYYYYLAPKSTGPTILVGMPLPLDSPIGVSMQDAANMAVSQINSAGGVNVSGTQYHFKIVTYDTHEADPSVPVAQGTSGVTSLITSSGVNYLIGGYRSDVVDAELPIAAQYKVPYITFGADPAISAYVQAHYSSGGKYIFNGFVNTTNQLAQYGAFPVYVLLAYDEGLIPTNVTNIAVLAESAAWTQSDIQQGGSSSPLWGAFQSAGFNPVYVNYFPLQDTGGAYNTIFSNLASLGTQSIYVLAAGTETPSLLSDYASFNWAADSATHGKKPLIMGADVMGEMQGSYYNYYSATNGGAAGELNLGWGPMLPVDLTPSSIPFYNEFNSTYGMNPMFEDGFVYSAFYYLANAIHEAGTLTGSAVVPYLEQTNYTGPAGTIKFSPNHGLVIPLTPVPAVPGVAMQWHTDGQLHLLWVGTNPLQFYNFETPTGQEIGNFTVTIP